MYLISKFVVIFLLITSFVQAALIDEDSGFKLELLFNEKTNLHRLKVCLSEAETECELSSEFKAEQSLINEIGLDKKVKVSSDKIDSVYKNAKTSLANKKINKKVKTYKLKIKDHSDGDGTDCTLSAFKNKSGCHIVSNEHCFFAPNSTFSYKRDIDGKEVSISPIKRDTDLDLIEFKVPEAEKKSLCKNLEEVKCLDEDEIYNSKANSDNYAVSGYVHGEEIKRRFFTNSYNSIQNIKDPDYVEVKSVTTSEIEKIVEIHPIEAHPGNSGGMLNRSSDGEPVGLVYRGIEYDETLLAIPMARVCKFVDKSEDLFDPETKLCRFREISNYTTNFSEIACVKKYESPLNDGRLYMPSGGDKGFSGGDKGFSGGDKGFSGGDKGFSGGDKGFSGGDKGFNGDLQCVKEENSKSSIQFINTFYEGYSDHLNNIDNVIAYRCNENSPWVRVVESEDITVKWRESPDCGYFGLMDEYSVHTGLGNKITKRPGQKLNILMRKKIMDRLKGNFSSKMGRHSPYEHNGIYYTTKDPKTIKTEIDINTEKKILTINHSSKDGKSIEQKKMNFEVSDNGEVKLKSVGGGEEYTCPNNEFLTLRCFSSDKSRAILISNSGGDFPEITYREFKSKDDSKIDYKHSRMRQVQ